jgi:heptosyltransferase-3
LVKYAARTTNDFNESIDLQGQKKLFSSLADRIGVALLGRTNRKDGDKESMAISANVAGKTAELVRLIPARSEKPVERIVIYRLGSLGDTIVALPCFHKLAEVFPEAERYVLTNKPVSSKAAPLEAILRGSGLVDGIIDYPIRLRSISQLWDLATRLKMLKASTLVYLTPPRGRIEVLRDIVFFRLCGFKRIVGAPKGDDLQDGAIDDATGLVEFECERLARSVAEFGPIDLDNRSSWDLRLTDQEREAGASALEPFDGRPFIAINMGGKVVENHWGNDNWRHLFRELALTHAAYGLLVIGAAEEGACVAEITAKWPSVVVNACGRLMPRESAAALEKARLFIGHDSGPMHLAAACGVDCVAPFGSQNPPRRWHPYGPRHRIIHHMEGIDAVRVDEIAAAVREALPVSADANVKL